MVKNYNIYYVLDTVERSLHMLTLHILTHLTLTKPQKADTNINLILENWNEKVKQLVQNHLRNDRHGIRDQETYF